MSEFTVPTHEVKTPIGGNVVVLKDFISGFDDEAIEAIYTRGRHKVTPQDPNDPNPAPANDLEIDGSSIQDAEREGVKRVVVSVDGKGEGDAEAIVQLVYSMHKDDTRFIKKACDAVINPKDDTPAKKKTGSKPTPAS